MKTEKKDKPQRSLNYQTRLCRWLQSQDCVNPNEAVIICFMIKQYQKNFGKVRNIETTFSILKKFSGLKDHRQLKNTLRVLKDKAVLNYKVNSGMGISIRISILT